MPKWYDLAEKSLKGEEEIQKSFPGKFNGEGGYLIFSDEKLLFVKEEGFLRKNYTLIQEMPYDKIGKIAHDDRYTMELTGVEGKKYKFETYGMPVKIIEDSLKELKE